MLTEDRLRSATPSCLRLLLPRA